MRKRLFSVLCAALGLLLAGCSSPPPPQPETPLTLLEQVQADAAEIQSAGGLAVVGIGKSKHPDLALNRARVDGRRKLAALLKQKISTLTAALPEEATPLAKLSGQLAGPEITGSAKQTVEQETLDETTYVYALLTLSPSLIDARLAKNPDLYARLKDTIAYEAFKAAPEM